MPVFWHIVGREGVLKMILLLLFLGLRANATSVEPCPALLTPVHVSSFAAGLRRLPVGPPMAVRKLPISGLTKEEIDAPMILPYPVAADHIGFRRKGAEVQMVLTAGNAAPTVLRLRAVENGKPLVVDDQGSRLVLATDADWDSQQPDKWLGNHEEQWVLDFAPDGRLARVWIRMARVEIKFLPMRHQLVAGFEVR
jgi:hypothetical protein